MKVFLQKIFFISLTLGFTATTHLFAADNNFSYDEAELYSICGGFIESPTFDSEGNLWLLDIPADRILSINDQGECLERAKSGGIPNGLMFNGEGELYVGGSNGILILNTQTSELTKVVDTFEGAPLVGINDLVFDKSGGLYFTASNSSDLFNPIGQVYYLAPKSNELTLVASKLAFPNGIVLSAEGGTILVAEFAAQRIVSLPAVNSNGFGASLLFANTEGGVGPDGMTMGEDGKLYVANLGSGRIQVFGNNGILLGMINLPASAGQVVSNVTIRENYLYITESGKGEIWRVHLNY